MSALTHVQLADHVERLFADVHVLRQNGGIKKGVNKNEYITRSYANKTNLLLKAGSLYLWKNWISASARSVFKESQDPRKSLLSKITEQMMRFAYNETMTKLNGKGENEDQQDDGAVALQMFGYWPEVVIQGKNIPHYQELVKGYLE